MMKTIHNWLQRGKRVLIHGHVAEFNDDGHAEVPEHVAEHVATIPGYSVVMAPTAVAVGTGSDVTATAAPENGTAISLVVPPAETPEPTSVSTDTATDTADTTSKGKRGKKTAAEPQE